MKKCLSVLLICLLLALSAGSVLATSDLSESEHGNNEYMEYGNTILSMNDYGSLSWPTSSTRITSGYGWRYAWWLNPPQWQFHHGIDIGPIAGASRNRVWSSANGRVSRKAFCTYQGFHIYVNTYLTTGPLRLEENSSKSTPQTVLLQHRYMHLARAPVFNVGTQIPRERYLADMGNTGNSEGTHLHFEIRRNLSGPNASGYNDGTSVNPFTYVNRGFNYVLDDAKGSGHCKNGISFDELLEAVLNSKNPVETARKYGISIESLNDSLKDSYTTQTFSSADIEKLNMIIDILETNKE